MREVDPFDYFVDHASAISGQGGQTMSPDPRYCFHTHYYPVRPGPALYRLHLSGTRSTMGELTVRVHAHRADGSSDVLLVAGTKMEIGRHNGDEVTLAVRFRAVKDVHYAYYGYFTEASDLVASDLKVLIEELEDEDQDADPFAEDVAVSSLAGGARGASASQASALVSAEPASLEVPVSQDCSLRQLRSRAFQAEAGRIKLDTDSTLRLWSEIACRQALSIYNAAMPGARLLMVGGESPLLTAFCEVHDMVVREIDWSPGDKINRLAEHGHVDVLVSWVDLAEPRDAEARYAAVTALLSRLLIGGLGLLCFRYVPDTATPSSSNSMAMAEELTRNEIGQWVLRLIGSHFSAAPLALSPVAELVRDEAGHAAIVLVFRRL